jgi:hypothetical protein
MFNKSISKNHSVDVLHNRFILFFVLFLSVVNTVSWALMNDFFFPTIFILIGIITSFFSNNMTVILTISLIVSNILKCVFRGHLSEGFQKTDDDDDVNKETDPDPQDGDDENDNQSKYDDITTTKNKLTNIKTKQIDSENIEGMQEKYKELMTLQDTILGQIGTLEKSLSNAENVVNNIVKSVGIKT